MPSLLGHQIGPIGYGVLTHTASPSPPSEEQALKSLRVAADLGCLVWCGAEFYGIPNHNSLTLFSRFFGKYPEYEDKVVLNIKGGLRPNWSPDGSPDFATQSLENCLRQLGNRGRIGTFAYARKDPKVPFETTLQTLEAAHQENKIDSLGLSEVNAKTIREASRVANIVTVEVELSLWCTAPLTNGIATTCAELGIIILAYCPLGRAMLTGKLQSPSDIPEGDFRKQLPRYQPENFDTNLQLVRKIQGLASEKRCTTAQVALGWLLGVSKRPGMPVIIPIPGSTSVDHIRENATVVDMTGKEVETIDSILSSHPIRGDRYHQWGMQMTDM